MTGRQRSVWGSLRAAIAAFGLFAAAGAFATTPTVSECTDEWEDSDAYDSCSISGSTDSISVTSDDLCSIESTCHFSNSGVATTARLSGKEELDEVSDMEICISGGHITLGSC